MPTRKQRRRREKELRHDYELVWEDAEGNELEPEDAPGNGSPKSSAKRGSARTPTAGRGRSGRQAQPPSWSRTLRRALVFAPIMFATVYLISPKLTLEAKLVQAAFIVAIFIPFSYLLDGFFWRNQQRRVEKDKAAGKRG